MDNKIMIHFETLEDLKQQSEVLHPMKSTVIIVLEGVLNGLDGWKGIVDFAKLQRNFLEKYLDLSNGILTDDMHYFITPYGESMADRVVYSIRRHWTIESIHWQLDVVSGKDSSLKRVKNSTENFNIVRKIILGLLKNDGIDYGKKLPFLPNIREKSSFGTIFGWGRNRISILTPNVAKSWPFRAVAVGLFVLRLYNFPS